MRSQGHRAWLLSRSASRSGLLARRQATAGLATGCARCRRWRSDPPLRSGAQAELASCFLALFPPLMIGHECRPAPELLAGDRLRTGFDRTPRPDRARPQPQALSAAWDGRKFDRMSGLFVGAAKTGETDKFSRPPGAEGPPRLYRRASSSARFSTISSASRPYNS